MKDKLKNILESKEYKFFNDDNNKTYDVNIIGIRNSTTGKKVTNLFDDLLTITFKDEKLNWITKEYKITTDPGKYFMQKKLGNKYGTAKLKEGQYRGSHQIGLHNGKYEALIQTGSKLTVWRDSNLNDIYDETKTDTGFFGINIHCAGTDSKTVDNYSAGCQVFKRKADFLEFMSICKKSKAIHGNKFTYTLINSDDLK